MKKCLLAASLTLCVAVFLPAQIEFKELALSSDNRLLFNTESRSRGALTQSVLSLVPLDTGRISVLTAFPERMELLAESRQIQLRNPFGLLRIPLSGGLPQSVKVFPGFSEGAIPSLGIMDQVLPSPDGKWLLRIEASSSARGRLVLSEVSTGISRVVSEGVERPGRFFPASWSPDSRLLVYARDSSLYYLPVDASTRPAIAERYRIIGEGEINCLEWGKSGDFFYMRGNAVYRVHSSILFARALYTSFIEVGTLTGKLPFSFDPEFDSFWPSVDGSSMLLSKGGKTIFWFPLGEQSLETLYAGDEASLYPYLVLPSYGSRITVLQSGSGMLTILLHPVRGSDNRVRAWRLENKGPHSMAFVPLDAPTMNGAALSPAGTQLLIWGDTGLSLWDYINWKPVGTISSTPTLQAAWISNDEIVLADRSLIEYRSLSGTRRTLCLSSAEEYAFEEESGAILAKSGGAWYRTDGSTPWAEAPNARRDQRRQQTGRYRVYLENLPPGPWVNIPMVRFIDSVGTRALLQRPVYEWDSLEKEESAALQSTPNLFIHGSRSGRRELAISFDLVDDAEGLQFVLSVLERYGLRATFFLGGEFIRRYPDFARELASLGHECASLFFANIDLFDSRYRIDGDFVKRGLARNEDDFFNATGRELSLLWHPPWYNSAPAFELAARDAGYITTGRDVDSLDWISWKSTRHTSMRYMSASELVDRIMEEKKPGSIIPIRLGINPGGRDDYLYHRLDVLVEALLRAGYDIVPISQLIEHARR